MGNFALDYRLAKVIWTLTLVVFPFALVFYLIFGVAFGSCDVRRRSDKHACHDGSAEKCLAVGKFYDTRSDGLIAFLLSNGTTARAYYDRACQLGNLTACARFGHLILHEPCDAMKGDDFTDADGIAALAKACDGNDPASCRELADTDSSRAPQIHAKLCDGGDRDACRQLVDEGDAEHAKALLERLCDQGDDDSCRRLGMGYLPSDPARAVELLTKSCKTNVDACFELGKLAIDSDPPRAVELFTASCEKGDPRACDALADIYRVGAPGVTRDRQRVFALHDGACRGGDDYNCFKRDCIFRDDPDACHKIRNQRATRHYRLDGRFDIR